MFRDIVILPFLKHPRISTPLVERYSKILLQGSTLYNYESPVPRGGTTGAITSVPSEALAYWSFDLMIASVSTSPAGAVSVTTLTLPTLLHRCEDVMRRYIDDGRLRGRMPLPR